MQIASAANEMTERIFIAGPSVEWPRAADRRTPAPASSAVPLGDRAGAHTHAQALSEC
jgi:hypothetical protein